MEAMQIKEEISNGHVYLGCELGSTRIKMLLINVLHEPVATGVFDWENRLVNGVWTYSEADIWTGIQGCYSDLRADVQNKYGVGIKNLSAIGVSAMMHGYLPFNKDGDLLVPFRTWRNTMTAQAAQELSSLFAFNIPQRWSIAHLYQAVLDDEPHVKDIAFITTLAGYVHWKLTGLKVLGIADASGMFPLEKGAFRFDGAMLNTFDQLVAKKAYPWKIADILPGMLQAGESGGRLTRQGAQLLDESGELDAGTECCPPEGDAGTGMVATNSIAIRTGNISAGTSIFAMIVLEKALHKPHPQIDIIATPTGAAVGMVHSNNCTTDLNAWVALFQELLEKLGMKASVDKLFETLYLTAMDGQKDCGGLLSYNFYAGEHIVDMDEGRPLMVRFPDAVLSLPNFMRMHLYSALATLKIGLNILLEEEKVAIDRVFGHGGFFKTKGVGQSMLAAVMNVPVSVLKTAGEGGAWGMAVLAAYMQTRQNDESLDDYLSNRVFRGMQSETLPPDPDDVNGFERYFVQYKTGLEIAKTAANVYRRQD